MSNVKLNTAAGGSVTLTPTNTASNLTATVVPDGDSSGASLVGYMPAGTGAVATTVQAKLREVASVLDFGADPTGVTDSSTAFANASVAVRSALTDGTGRTYAGTVYVPKGNYRIANAIAFAPVGGVVGLTIQGDGSGSTILNFDGASTTLTCASSRAVTFKDIGFTSSGIDNEQTAFTVNQTGNPLRSWRFERCEFAAFWKCFSVTGSSMCSEFYFQDCQFSQCYYLMDNSNDQAVNWNFVNCNWENEALVTTKDKNLSAVFKMQKGTFAKWTGGSLIFEGMLAYFNLTASGSFQRTVHKIAFDGVRIELVDRSGSHAYMTDRVSVGYVNGSNHPTVSFSNFSILNRGALPATTPYFKVWGNCSLALTNGEAEGGVISGVIDGVTPNQNADVKLIDTKGISYVEDVTARVSDHDSHNVHIEPDTSSADGTPILDLRLCSLSAPATAMSKRMYVRGPTGSIPLAGTTVNLPSLQDHFTLLTIFCYRFTAAGQALTIELKDQADTTVYGTLTVNAGVTNGEGYVGKEMGFQIPSSTALMLKFTGTPEIVKGVVGLEYL